MTGNRLARLSPQPPPLGRQGYLVRGAIAPVFVERGALAPEEAIYFAPGTATAAEWERLRDSGAIRQAGGRWWLDIVAYQASAQARSRAALPWIVAGALLVAALAMLLYRG